MVISHIIFSFIFLAGGFGLGMWFQKRVFAKAEAVTKSAIATVTKDVSSVESVIKKV